MQKNSYREGLKKIKNKDNPFCPEAQLDFYDSLEPHYLNDARRSDVISFFKSFSLIKLGQEKEAIEILDKLVDQIKTNPDDQLFKMQKNCWHSLICVWASEAIALATILRAHAYFQLKDREFIWILQPH